MKILMFHRKLYIKTRQTEFEIIFSADMYLTLMYLFHEYVAKSIVPYYKLRYEAREAANRLIEAFRNHPDTFIQNGINTSIVLNY